jgi:hypothetical protein
MVLKKVVYSLFNNRPKKGCGVELKRIDTLWHFLVTQNQLFLKRNVDKEVTYRIVKGEIELRHQFQPNFLEKSSLIIQNKNFGVPVQHYSAEKKRFGIKLPFQKPNERLFFPKELLRLANIFSFYVDKDKAGGLRVTLIPFQPKNFREIIKPVNLVTKTLWSLMFFSETIKN